MPGPKQADLDRHQLIKLYRQALLKDGSFEEVEDKVKKRLMRLMVADKVERQQDREKTRQAIQAVPAVVRVGASLLPLFLIVVGFLLLGSATLPIVGFYIKTVPQIRAEKLASPIPEDKILDSSPLVTAQMDQGGELGEVVEQLHQGPVIVDAELDYTNLSNWFDDETMVDLSSRTNLLSQEVGEYILEIPKLNIENAVVKIGGTDLDESLIQYPGTSLPGKPGNPVIFGHSLLRQFYNPKESNPRRYNSIFSTIMTLEAGDKIYIYYGDVKYTYVVQSKTEVKPTDTHILSQEYNSRQLKLVTCVPEGTYLRRGVVMAQLVRE